MMNFQKKRVVLFLFLVIVLSTSSFGVVSEEPNPDIWVMFTNQGRVNVTDTILYNSTGGTLIVDIIEEGVNEPGIYNEIDDTHLFHFKPGSPNEFLPNGDYSFSINATDAQGNLATQEYEFTVIVPTLHIEITDPSYGVANVSTYYVGVKTYRDTNLTNASHCRYNLNSDRTYNNMDKRLFNVRPSDLTNSTHITQNIVDGDYTMYVRCRDTYTNDYLQVFEIKSDTTAPSISAISVDPNPIVEEDNDNPTLNMNIQTRIFVDSDDEVVCKYHNSSVGNFNTMDYNFTGFPLIEESYKTRSEALVMELRDDTTYTKYIICKNKAELQSVIATTSFNVWLDAPLEISEVHSPNATASSRRDFLLNFSTNKHTNCLYGAEDEPAINAIDGNYAKNHYRIISGISKDGVYNYTINCTFFDQKVSGLVQFTSDRTPPLVPYVNDSNPRLYEDPEYSYNVDQIYLKWNSSDALSGIERYEIQILEMTGSSCGGGPIVKDWFNYTPEADEDERESAWFEYFDSDYDDGDGDDDDDPELVDGRKYCFQVRAVDEANQMSNIAKTDGVIIDVSRRPRETTAPLVWINVTQLNNEAEVVVACLDMGNNPSGCNKNNFTYGLSETSLGCEDETSKYLAPFTLNQTMYVCYKVLDYAGNAANGAEKVEVIIVEPGQCADKVKGENETDIDCGGDCQACSIGRACLIDGDCNTGFCKDEFCARPSCDDEITNQDETDIDCGGSCNSCGLNMSCLTHIDCISGSCQGEVCVPATCDDVIKNQNETDIDCGGPCGPCQNLQSCKVDNDCVSGFCDSNVCQNRQEQVITPVEEKKSIWPWILGLLIIIIIAGVAAYFLMPKKPKVPIQTQVPVAVKTQAPKPQAVRASRPKVDYKKLLEARKKRKLEAVSKKLAEEKRHRKEMERLGMFDEFGGEGELDEDGQPKVVSKIPFSKKNATKKYTVFDKLSNVLGEKESFDKLDKMGGSFDKLSKVLEKDKTFGKLSKILPKQERIKKENSFDKLKKFVSGKDTKEKLSEISGTETVFDKLPKVKKK